jgi:hypothetical protein
LKDIGLIEIQGQEYDICISHCCSNCICGDIFLFEKGLVRMIGFRDGCRYCIDEIDCICEIGPDFRLIERSISICESTIILYDCGIPIVVSICLEDFGGLGVKPCDEVLIERIGKSIVAGVKDEYLWLVNEEGIFCESIFEVDFCESTSGNQILHRPAKDLSLLYAAMKCKSTSSAD